MNHPNLNELSQKIHEANKAKGWRDNLRPPVQTAWLVVERLAKASEAERAGKYADLEALDIMRIKTNNWNWVTPMEWPDAFRKHIKDTFEDEIASAVICLLDYANGHSLDLVTTASHIERGTSNEEVFFKVSGDLHQMFTKNRAQAFCISAIVADLEMLSELRGFNLWQHVELKLKYNATRPKMHGRKKF